MLHPMQQSALPTASCHRKHRVFGRFIVTVVKVQGIVAQGFMQHMRHGVSGQNCHIHVQIINCPWQDPG
eukprot:1161418-Pelagomonas_calceolata.AAC.1